MSSAYISLFYTCICIYKQYLLLKPNIDRNRFVNFCQISQLRRSTDKLDLVGSSIVILIFNRYCCKSIKLNIFCSVVSASIRLPKIVVDINPYLNIKYKVHSSIEYAANDIQFSKRVVFETCVNYKYDPFLQHWIINYKHIQVCAMHLLCKYFIYIETPKKCFVFIFFVNFWRTKKS